MRYKLKPVYLEWVDSVSPAGTWHSMSKVQHMTAQRSTYFSSIGYLVNENEDEYVLAMSVQQDLDISEEPSFGSLFIVPKGAVVKFKKLNGLPEPKITS